MKKKKFNMNILSCIFELTLALVFFISTFAIKEPDSRLVPRCLCGLIALLCGVFLYQILFGKYKDEELDFSGTWRAMQMGIVIVGYILLNYLFGFYIASVVFLPVGMLFLGQRNWKAIVGVSAGLPLLIYLFFDLLLTMQMAQGVFF